MLKHVANFYATSKFYARKFIFSLTLHYHTKKPISSSRTSPASVLNMVALLLGFGGDHGHVVRGGHRGWFGGRWTACDVY